MIAEIITIGDEILIGQIVDTNSAWIAQELNLIGIKIKQISSVSDDEQHIIKSIEEAKSRANLILITGGLGPTKDDLTKNTLCKYFNVSLKFDARAYKDVERLFKSRGREVTEINRKQAELPENCKPIYNAVGTAPGMWFEQEGKIIVSMPGVPHEMKEMMKNDVLKRLPNYFDAPVILHKTILTQGVGESFLSEMISNWEDELPNHIKLAYLPAPGVVRLRLSATGTDKSILTKEVDDLVIKLKEIAGKYIYGYDEDSLEKLVGELLLKRKQTLSLAESCSGGYISHLITSIPGSSAYYKGSIVAYDYEVKTKELGVKKETLEKHGAVSEKTVIEMAEGVKEKLNTDYSVACSGIAGPGGGTPDKPVGTVWIAVSMPGKTITKKFQLGDNRERVIRETSLHALNMLRKEMMKEF
jgi:nicotinamide-nucleotide amidase